MDEKKLHEILMRCISKTDIRKHLHRPQLTRNKLYYCDGIIMIEAPVRKDIDAETEQHINFLRLKDEYIHDGLDYFKMPPLHSVKVVCQYCYGTGYEALRTPCEACEGNGEFSHYDRLYDCKSCDGEGAFRNKQHSGKKCECCNGTKESKASSTKIREGLFGTYYLRIISELPGAEIALTKRHGDTTTHHLAIRYAHGFGILMGRNG
ncbi:MAG: hypothetical protein LBI35_04410 [Burkholderiales bacterium]|jgi:hypothetical protein|nr:hypothetical protein [Burkholderiales bacterium]